MCTTARRPKPTPPDPPNLCIFATVALLTWLVGATFAVLGFVGDWRAWRKGLRRTKCWLRDTRLVLPYLLTAYAALP
ncbi:hypothetical protein OG874_12670 [Nocardia sp. NBC_00565]|uniref:hypothetical protein n=1 Tax=Nocardia sp. NBC_00565 TaxID=2975993 RepID=UPI002E81FFC5|nr:hypothetical protein [Nocardia sp. NBC_00565]WUC05932.1 hypothetical protein OG874_12670 [Nocardia sp. NBC_00565]